MAIPSGSGTEVLKRASIHALSDAWSPIITGVANHIYTVLSISACNNNGSTDTANMRIDISAAVSNQIVIFTEQSITAKATFVWNDRLILTGTDKLEVYNTAGNMDWFISYIDQDWT